jgi:hypothetical protein
VSEAFSIDGRADPDYEILWDFAAERRLRFPIWFQDGYSVAELEGYEPEGTFILLHEIEGPVGFYTDAQCWIDPAHRGRHLSTPLILAAANFNGGSPVNSASRPWGPIGFSEAGYAAHQAAHRAAVQAAGGSALACDRRADRGRLDLVLGEP